MVILITTAAFAVLTLLLSMMFVIYKIASDCRTHTNGFVKTVLKVFIILFDGLLGYQTAMVALDVLKLSPKAFEAYCDALTKSTFDHVYLTVTVVFVLVAMLLFYRNTNRKIYVTSGYRLDGKEIDAKWKKGLEKEQKKAEKRAAADEKKAEKKAASEAKRAEKIAAKEEKRKKAVEDAKAAEPVEVAETKASEAPAEPVEAPAENAEAPVAEPATCTVCGAALMDNAAYCSKCGEAVPKEPERKKVIAHRRKISM